MRNFRRAFILAAFLAILISMHMAATFADGEGKGNGGSNGGKGNGGGDEKGEGNGGKGDDDGGKGKGNGKGDEEGKGKGDEEGKGKGKGDEEGKGKGKGDEEGKDKGKGDEEGKGKGKGNGKPEKESPHYKMLPPVAGTGQEQCSCQAKGACFEKTLVCPGQCPERKPKKNKKMKGCYVDCSNKCEATCKIRKANCDGYGSLCYDPRFVGGDGVMFYFHGAKGGNFAIVSDTDLQINAHFIGTRPEGRTRDFTWVQALAVIFDSHTLVLAAKRVAAWDDNVDALIVKWDGEMVGIPTDGEAEWRYSDGQREVVVERTDDANNVRVTVTGLVEMDVKVRAIGTEENRVHRYQIPADDSFAHLETQFRFSKLTDSVEGVLGKTYQPNYVSPVKIGVPMPMMGGEDKYQTPSLFSTLCKACRFKRETTVAAVQGLAQY